MIGELPEAIRAVSVGFVAVKLLAAVTAALVAASVADASTHPLVYKGRLGRHGTMEIDIARSRATVYFFAPCQGQDVGTNAADSGGVSYDPPRGRVRAGHLRIASNETGFSHDEGSSSPPARIRIKAVVASDHITGTFRLDQGAGSSVANGSAGISGCSTGKIRFMIRR